MRWILRDVFLPADPVHPKCGKEGTGHACGSPTPLTFPPFPLPHRPPPPRRPVRVTAERQPELATPHLFSIYTYTYELPCVDQPTPPGVPHLIPRLMPLAPRSCWPLGAVGQDLTPSARTPLACLASRAFPFECKIHEGSCCPPGFFWPNLPPPKVAPGLFG